MTSDARREQYARIIDPHAWEYDPDDALPTEREIWNKTRPLKQALALAKADAILALESAEIERLTAERETLLTVIIDTAKELGCAADNETMLAVIADLKARAVAPMARPLCLMCPGECVGEVTQ